MDVVDRAGIPGPAAVRRARDPQETVVRWLALLAPLMLVGLAVAVVDSEPDDVTTLRHVAVGLAVVAFAVGVLVADRTDDRPRGRAYAVAVVLALGGAALLAALQPEGPGTVAIFVAVVLAVRRVPPRAVIPVLVTAFVLLEVVTALIGDGLAAVAALGIVAAFFAMLILAHRLAAANREAERLLEELAAQQEALARAAGVAERQRLAREVHDVLAHALSGLLLQLEGARMLAVEDPADPRLRTVIDRAHHLGRGGLDEARSAIGMLRDGELPGPERLPDLAARFTHDRGVPCAVTVTGEERPLQPQARLAVYRVAQEALTNAGRHATPERVEVRLDFRPASTRLVIEDVGAADPPGAEDGRGVPEDPASHDRLVAAPPEPGAAGPTTPTSPGYGLTGMRERAELLGGTLTTTTTERGFRVELDVPA